MTLPDSQSAMNQELYRILLSKPCMRLGEAINRAKASRGQAFAQLTISKLEPEL